MPRRSSHRWSFQPPAGTPIDLSHPQAQGLVGFWPLNEPGNGVVYDLSSYALHLDPSATPPDSLIDRRGRVKDFPDTASQYYGSGSRNVSHIDPLRDGPMTISLWVQCDLENSQYLLTKGTGSDASWALYVDAFNRAQLLLFRATTNMFVRTETGALSYDTEWTHIVVTYAGGDDADGAGTGFYGNGVALTKTTGTDGSGASDNDGEELRIGRSDFGQYLDGVLSDVRIYNRVLSDAEVAQIYTNPYAIYQPRRVSVRVPAAGAYSLAIDASSYTWTPQTVGLAYGRVLGAGVASYTWTPQDVGAAYGRVVGVDAASYAWTPQALTDLRHNKVIPIDAASYTWTAQNVGLAYGRMLGVDAAAYTWTPQTVGLAFGRVLSVDSASYTWSPQDVTLTWSGAGGATIEIGAASYAWTPQTVGLAYGRVLGVGAASYAWTPQALTDLRHNKVAAIDAATYSWTPQTVGLAYGRHAGMDAAAYAWTPQTVGLAMGRVLGVGSVSYTWTAQDVTLTWSGAAALPDVGRTFTVTVTPRRFTTLR